MLFAVGYVYTFHAQAGYSLMVSDNTAVALDMLEADPDSHGVVTNAYTFALWVAALNRVPASWAWTAQPPGEYTDMDASVRCVLGWVPGCDPGAAAAGLEATHVLVDTRFPRLNGRVPDNYLAPPRQWEVTASAPWLTLLYSEGTTRLWALN